MVIDSVRNAASRCPGLVCNGMKSRNRSMP